MKERIGKHEEPLTKRSQNSRYKLTLLRLREFRLKLREERYKILEEQNTSRREELVVKR